MKGEAVAVTADYAAVFIVGGEHEIWQALAESLVLIEAAFEHIVPLVQKEPVDVKMR
jgi:hypothetical protein